MSFFVISSDLNCNINKNSGSPIQFYADVMAPGHVTAYGSGLVTGKVDEPAEFTIVTKDAGAGMNQTL